MAKTWIVSEILIKYIGKFCVRKDDFMSCVYFVRHGETVWNVENKICGSTDIDLTQKGHEQAIETGKKILNDKDRKSVV